MRLKWIIASVVFIIVSIVSFQIVPQYIGSIYYKKAIRSLCGYEVELTRNGMWIPRNPDDLYRKNPDYNDAISKFKIARRFGIERLKCTTKIGFAYNELKQYENAITFFQEALAMFSKDDDAGRGLVESLIQLGKYNEAERVALDRLSYLSNNENAYLELTKIYALKKDLIKAKECGLKYVELTDAKKRLDIMERISSRDLLMHVYCDLGEYENAIKTLEEILKLDPKRYAVYWNMAQVYDKLGNKEKALENWKKVIALNDPPKAVEQAKQRVKELEVQLKPKNE